MASRCWMDVVERAYELQSEEEVWLAQLVEAAGALKLGAWAYAFTCDVSTPGAPRIGATAGRGATTDWTLGRASLEAIPPPMFTKLFGSGPPVGLATRALRGTPEPIVRMIKAMWQAAGVVDHLGIKGWNPDGSAVVLAFAQARTPRLAPRTLASLTRISAHMTAGLRLRRALGINGPLLHDPSTEAVMDASGAVVHATRASKSPEARDALSRASLLRDRARGRMRRTDPERALAIWRGLVEGRWTLLDHLDTDGKRLVLAKRNDPSVHDSKTLTLRERQVLALARLGHSNKLIAYELGLGASTVATHLASALSRLKLGSRRDLIQMFGPGVLGAGAGAAQA